METTDARVMHHAAMQHAPVMHAGKTAPVAAHTMVTLEQRAKRRTRRTTSGRNQSMTLRKRRAFEMTVRRMQRPALLGPCQNSGLSLAPWVQRQAHCFDRLRPGVGGQTFRRVSRTQHSPLPCC